ncbi:CNNM domain-containing protein [Gammaproteobacteria bacterium]|nr:CNNM domain-containing protein [Gammaproteobacteria bacterium]
MLIAFCLTLLVFSAFFSGSETAILSLDLYRVDSDADDGDSSAIKLRRYLENPEQFLGIVLLGNTLSNIAAASIFTVWLSQFNSETAIATGTIGLTLFVLIFCEILPKSIAARHSYRFSKTVLRPIHFFEVLMQPVLIPLNRISKLYLRQSKHQLSDHDIRRIVRSASQQLPSKERIMLEGVLSICTANVESLMTPIHMVKTITPSQINNTPKDFLNTQNILVSEKQHVDDILGILTHNDQKKLPLKPSREDLLRHMTPPHYILEGTIVSQQLESFQTHHNRVSIVIDEYGKPLGVLDLGNILDELLGSYSYQHTHSIGQIKQTADGRVWVKAQTRIKDLNQVLSYNLPTQHSQTIGGMLVNILQSPPDEACCIQTQWGRFDILSLKNQKIEWVEIHPNKSAETLV